MQDFPIAGSMLLCKVLSLEIHTLFGVSYGKLFWIYKTTLSCPLPPVSLAAISIVRCLVVWTRGNSCWLGRYQLSIFLIISDKIYNFSCCCVRWHLHTLLLLTWVIPAILAIPLFRAYGGTPSVFLLHILQAAKHTVGGYALIFVVLVSSN